MKKNWWFSKKNRKTLTYMCFEHMKCRSNVFIFERRIQFLFPGQCLFLISNWKISNFKIKTIIIHPKTDITWFFSSSHIIHMKEMQYIHVMESEPMTTNEQWNQSKSLSNFVKTSFDPYMLYAICYNNNNNTNTTSNNNRIGSVDWSFESIGMSSSSSSSLLSLLNWL